VQGELHFQAVARIALDASGKFEVKNCPSGEVALGEAVAFDPMALAR
jgi:hypothetical protein